MGDSSAVGESSVLSPSVEVIDRFSPGMNDYTIGDKFDGTIDYEVIDKSEHGIELKIKNIIVKKNKRIKQ